MVHLQDSAVPRAADTAAWSWCGAALAGEASKVVDAVNDAVADSIAPVTVIGTVALVVRNLQARLAPSAKAKLVTRGLGANENKNAGLTSKATYLELVR